MAAQEVLDRLKAAENFAKLVTEVEDSIGEPIREYCERLPDVMQKSPGKAFKDAVWGMIDLQDREVLILDSPPLQRLRRVRQLGLGYLTYPTAGYSRFEHTLGAVHQAERMLRAIARRSGDGSTIEKLLTDSIDTVRLAAMLHDIGHLPLSHVSERFYTDAECRDPNLVEPVNATLNEIALELPGPRIKLAEALSLAIISSPSFETLLTEHGGYEREAVATAVLAIAGRPPSVSEAFIAQLISNVVDADKLDYMFRDAFVTRVPLAVDLERLLFKLECLEVDYDNLPTEFLQKLAEQDEKGFVLGTDLAGDRLSYDIAISRSMLFERVYFHHKTRAAERVALAALRELSLPPAQLLAFDDNFFAQHGVDRFPDQLSGPVAMLLNRRLPRRAMALSYQFFIKDAPTDKRGNVAVEDDKTSQWDSLNDDLNQATSRVELELEIQTLAREFAEMLGHENDFRVDVDTVPESPGVNDSELMVRLPDDRKRKNTVLPAKFAAFTYDPFAIAHVFAGGNGRPEYPVFIAAEMTIERRYGLHFGDAAANYAKVRWDEVERIKRQLEATKPDLFATQGALRPLTLLRDNAAANQRVNALAERFAHYDAISKADNSKKLSKNVDAARIFAFLDQFPERLAEPMLTVLEHIAFLGREELGVQFGAALAEESVDGLVCAPLTDRVGKSAEHLGLYLEHSGHDLKLRTMSEVLKDDGPVVFYDDLTISGKQARTVVQTWAQLPTDLDEDLADPLDEAQLEQLRQRGVRFRFAYARPAGIEAMAEATKAAGLGEDVSSCVLLDEAESPLDACGADAEPLRDFLLDVGRELLLSTKHIEDPEKWTEDLCDERALGYSLAERLVVLGYNTPTSTLTALWKSGTYRNTDWLPLFPRRGESLTDSDAREKNLPLIEQ